MSHLHFKFEETESALETATQIASTMLDDTIPLDKILSASYERSVLDEAMIRRCLADLSADKVRISVGAMDLSDLDIVPDQTEARYNVRYALVPVDDDLRRRCTDPTPCDALTLPPINSFVPKELFKPDAEPSTVRGRPMRIADCHSRTRSRLCSNQARPARCGSSAIGNSTSRARTPSSSAAFQSRCGRCARRS